MIATLTDEPVLIRFRKSLNEMYGDRIERVVLFGSRARGAKADGMLERWSDENRWRVLLENTPLAISQLN